MKKLTLIPGEKCQGVPLSTNPVLDNPFSTNPVLDKKNSIVRLFSGGGLEPMTISQVTWSLKCSNHSAEGAMNT